MMRRWKKRDEEEDMEEEDVEEESVDVCGVFSGTGVCVRTAGVP